MDGRDGCGADNDSAATIRPSADAAATRVSCGLAGTKVVVVVLVVVVIVSSTVGFACSIISIGRSTLVLSFMALSHSNTSN